MRAMEIAIARGFEMFEERRSNLPARGPGRPKGSPNKMPALLKDAVLKAADSAGGPEGLVGYLTTQAIENPVPFMTLLGKILPMQGAGESDVTLNLRWIENVIVDPADTHEPNGRF